MIELDRVTKRYNRLLAVDQLSLTLARNYHADLEQLFMILTRDGWKHEEGLPGGEDNGKT